MTGRAARVRSRTTLATQKARQKEIQETMQDVTTKVEGPLTKLLGTQTDDFTLKGLSASSGDIAGDAYNVPIETSSGTTLYLKAGTAQA